MMTVFITRMDQRKRLQSSRNRIGLFLTLLLLLIITLLPSLVQSSTLFSLNNLVTRNVQESDNNNATTSLTYCACQYNVPYEKELGCRSYGQLGDDILIPWYRSNQTCLDTYDIKVISIDRTTLSNICPYANSTNVNIQLLLNEIRYNPSPATRAIQASLPMFWVINNDTSSSTFTSNDPEYVLVDQIIDGFNNPNCIESETLCYNSIREYFTLNINNVLDTICMELYNRQRFDMDLEQSTIRIRLCQEISSSSSTSDIPTDCEPLVSQIKDIQQNNPGKACSAYGLGPGTQSVPTTGSSNCSLSTTATDGDDDTMTSGTSHHVTTTTTIIIRFGNSHHGFTGWITITLLIAVATMNLLPLLV